MKTVSIHASALKSGILLLALLFASSARAQLYSVLDIGYLGVNGTTTGVNNSGAVVGYIDRGSSNYQAFEYQNGTMTFIGGANGTTSRAFGINDLGEVVGDTSNAGAFAYSNGVMTLLPSTATAYAVNDSGTIVGINSQSAAFEYSNGTTNSLLPAFSFSYGKAINSTGTIAGDYTTNTSNGPTHHAFVIWNGVLMDVGSFFGGSSYSTGMSDNGYAIGTYTIGGITRSFEYLVNSGAADFGTLGGDQAFAKGINRGETIVGSSNLVANGPLSAFIRLNFEMEDLNRLLPQGSVHLTSANAISQDGDIAAMGSDGHGYLLTPMVTAIPEPSTYATIIGLAAFALAVARRRRRGAF